MEKKSRTPGRKRRREEAWKFPDVQLERNNQREDEKKR